MNIWDFGGQEIYYATHQFFLTKRSLYVLVIDNRKEDDMILEKEETFAEVIEYYGKREIKIRVIGLSRLPPFEGGLGGIEL